MNLEWCTPAESRCSTALLSDGSTNGMAKGARAGTHHLEQGNVQEKPLDLCSTPPIAPSPGLDFTSALIALYATDG